ncbi:unnamed protein product [Blumeria hordei]|uniref:Uncharacterized protein n=1 Tax=Blumeria hordei TaxID=2867405 RepID=A0A383UPU7_BLUHO|nr:unnamed protein product [Blumeria hordei]
MLIGKSASFGLRTIFTKLCQTLGSRPNINRNRARMLSRPIDSQFVPAFADPLRPDKVSSTNFQDCINKGSINIGSVQSRDKGLYGTFRAKVGQRGVKKQRDTEAYNKPIQRSFHRNTQRPPLPLPPPRRSNDVRSAYANQTVQFEDESFDLWDSDDFQQIYPNPKDNDDNGFNDFHEFNDNNMYK